MVPSKIVITPILLASVDDESREDKIDTPATGKGGIKALFNSFFLPFFNALRAAKTVLIHLNRALIEPQ